MFDSEATKLVKQKVKLAEDTPSRNLSLISSETECFTLSLSLNVSICGKERTTSFIQNVETKSSLEDRVNCSAASKSSTDPT